MPVSLTSVHVLIDLGFFFGRQMTKPPAADITKHLGFHTELSTYRKVKTYIYSTIYIYIEQSSLSPTLPFIHPVSTHPP
jgi:hypothetical protein